MDGLTVLNSVWLLLSVLTGRLVSPTAFEHYRHFGQIDWAGAVAEFVLC